MKRVEVPSYSVSIFVAGADVRPICQAYCDEIGLCVTLTPTSYVYTGGAEDGWIIGLINYGRFPSAPADILAKAEALALRIIKESGGLIQSATVQPPPPENAVWISFREGDA